MFGWKLSLRRFLRGLSLIAAIVALFGLTSPAFADPPLTVRLASCPSARVTGLVGDYPGGVSGSMRQFLGIPYAAPPTGANRWQPPQPHCWTGIRNAQVFGPLCPQGASLQPWANEDCLSLNVFTEPTGDVRKRPVMVWIHGGALTSGSGSWVLANPLNLVSKGVIVVTINYRIGALGFLSHPALDNIATRNTGNYGLLDQQAALAWVKANIGKFGGNPDNITVIGQSAGGLSILTHLVSPLGTNLFHKAIIQSGALYAGTLPLTAPSGQDSGQARGRQFANSANCSSTTFPALEDQAACLRALSVDAILQKQGSLGASTQLIKRDGVVLNQGIGLELQSGNFQKIPILHGSNHDESRFHLLTNQGLGTGGQCAFTSNIVPDDQQASFPGSVSYTSALQGSFGGTLAPLVKQRYPSGASPLEANTAFTAANTDRLWACRALRVNKWIAMNGGLVFSYELKDPSPPIYQTGPITLRDGANFPMASYHGAEMPFLTPMPATVSCGLPYAGLTAEQQAMSEAMLSYWTQFAKRGNPNPATTALPKWNAFAGLKPRLMSFIPGAFAMAAAARFDRDHKCSTFWDTQDQ